MTPPQPKSGLFIVFDGVNGAGKSTQIRCLSQKLTEAGYDVLSTREPGGTPEAEFLRREVVSDTGHHWDAVEELLLFTTARHHHVVNKIKPALSEGKIVLCDRWIPSTIAYQGYGGSVSMERIRHATKLAIGDFDADLTFLFFVDPEVGVRRALASSPNETRIENFDALFHARAYAGYEAVYEDANRHVMFGQRTCFRIDDRPDHDFPSLDAKISLITDRIYHQILSHINHAKPTLKHTIVEYQAE